MQMAQNLTSLAVKSFGKLDGLVINHGSLYSEKVATISLDEFKRSYDVNVFSCLAMVGIKMPSSVSTFEVYVRG